MFNFDAAPSGKTALICPDCSVGYADLREFSGRLNAALDPRSLVLCLARNTAGAVCGYAGLMEGGHVPLLLEAATNPAAMAGYLEKYRPAFVWLPADRAGDFPDYKERLRVHDYLLLETGYGASFSLHPDLALLLPTSGSTGSPKLVRHSHGNLESNINAIIAYLKIDKTRRAITTLPMHYTYGLSVINIHLMARASLALTDLTVPDRKFWDFFRQSEATSISGVPYTWLMLERLGIMRMDLPCLKYCDQAGGKLDAATQTRYIQWAEATGREFIVMYGQTEASPRMGYLPWHLAASKPGCMGVPVEGGSFHLLDENGREVIEPGVEGELIYEGPNVTMGYATSGAALALGDERHGKLETGDMATRDADGIYRITGRKSRFLKLYGKRVSLDETEKLLAGEFPGLDCCCGGQDDNLVVYVCQGGMSDAIRNYLAAFTGINQRAFAVKMVEAIPRNQSGKVLYRELGEIA